MPHTIIASGRVRACSIYPDDTKEHPRRRLFGDATGEDAEEGLMFDLSPLLAFLTVICKVALGVSLPVAVASGLVWQVFLPQTRILGMVCGWSAVTAVAAVVGLIILSLPNS